MSRTRPSTSPALVMLSGLHLRLLALVCLRAAPRAAAGAAALTFGRGGAQDTLRKQVYERSGK